MVSEIPTASRNLVMTLWLDGKNYREIEAETGVSLGAITPIIDEVRRKASDIDELRALNSALRKEKAALLDALRGAIFLQQLNDQDVDVTKVPYYIKSLSRYGSKASPVLESALELMELETTSHMTYAQIVADATAKEQRARKLQDVIAGLEGKEKAALASMREVDGLRAIAAKIKAHRITADRLDVIIENGVKLERLGFTTRVAEALASGLAVIGLEPLRSVSILTRLLSEGQGLEGAIVKLREDERRLQMMINAKGDELTALSRKEEALLSRIADLERQVEEKRHSNAQRELDFIIKRDELDTALAQKRDDVEALRKEGEEYDNGLKALRAEGARFEEELAMAKIVLGMSKYPEQLKGIPLDYDLRVFSGIVDHVKAKGINPSFSLHDLDGGKHSTISSYSKVGLVDVLEWASRALWGRLPQSS